MTATTASTDGAGLLGHIEPVTVWAEYAGGGSLRIGRYYDQKALTQALDGGVSRAEYVVVGVTDDTEEGQPIDNVSLHDDQGHEVELLDRAIVALRAAREAFMRAQF